MSSGLKLCAICGIKEATTLDHLPPKGIFPKPRPSNLIKVPACAECNNHSSELDEAFRMYLALHVSHFADESTAAYFEDALRTYNHNKKLQQEIMGHAKFVDFKTASGDYVGQGMKILWNSKAHDAVIERMARGLYFHHFREVLPPGTQVAPKWLNKPDEKLMQTLNESGLTKNIIGKNQLVYLYGRTNEHPAVSVWYFEFYGSHWAAAHTRVA